MSDEAGQILEALATKLGTTTEFLWGVLEKQVNIEIAFGCVGLAICSVILFICCVAVFVINYFLSQAKKKEGDYCDSSGFIFAHIINGTITIMTIIPFSCNLVFIINALMNPEYFVLREILRSIR